MASGNLVAKQCADDEAKMEKALHWTAMKVVVTKSQKWGTLWRADVALARKPNEPQAVTRLVCWKSGTGDKSLSTLVAPVELFDPKAGVPLLR